MKFSMKVSMKISMKFLSWQNFAKFYITNYKYYVLSVGVLARHGQDDDAHPPKKSGCNLSV